MRPRCGNNNKIQLYIEVKFSCQNFKVREQRRGHEQAEEGNCSFKETVGRFACSYDWTYTGKPKLKGIQVFVLVYFAPCNVIRIPESREHLLVVSEIQKTLACGIRNPLSWNLKSSTWDLESTSWNLESKIVMDYLTWGDIFLTAALSNL